MNTHDGLDALRRANPRSQAGFAEAVAAARRVRPGLITHGVRDHEATRRPAVLRRRLIAVSAAGVGVAAAAGVTAVLLGAVGTLPGTGTRTGSGAAAIQDPAAALHLAAAVTSSAAQDSGKAQIRLTKDGQAWAGMAATWNGDNLASVDPPEWQAPNSIGQPEGRLVDGILYALDLPDQSGWTNLGAAENICCGITPLTTLNAIREDVAGQTLTRITDSMTDLTTTTGPDGSVTYSGHAPAGVVAREQSVKEGQTIRVLPYGYVAHDDGSNPASPVAMTIVAGPDHLVRSITAEWGGGSQWRYTVTFSELGSAPEIVAPEHAKPPVLPSGPATATSG